MKVYSIAFIGLLTVCACQSKIDDSETYFEVRDAYTLEVDDFVEKIMTTPPAEQQALAKEAPDRLGYIDTLLYFIKRNPEASYAGDAYVELYNTNSSKYRDSAIIALTKYHPNSDAMERLHPLMIAQSKSPHMLPWIEAVLSENKNETVLGLFTLAYADRLTQPNNDSPEDVEKGLAMYETVIEKYSDYKVDGTNPGTKVKLGDLASDAKRRLTELAVGQKAPEIVSIDLKGNEVKLSDYAGKVVVLDLWATWCGPCIEMIPHQTEMVQNFKNKPFELVSVSIDEKIETVDKFHAKRPMPWTQWFNGAEGGILSQWNISRYPTIIIIDKKGIIRHRNDGAMSGEELTAKVSALLTE